MRRRSEKDTAEVRLNTGKHPDTVRLPPFKFRRGDSGDINVVKPRSISGYIAEQDVFRAVMLSRY